MLLCSPSIMYPFPPSPLLQVNDLSICLIQTSLGLIPGENLIVEILNELYHRGIVSNAFQGLLFCNRATAFQSTGKDKRVLLVGKGQVVGGCVDFDHASDQIDGEGRGSIRGELRHDFLVSRRVVDLGDLFRWGANEGILVSHGC
jgi:hypothetical protein